MSFAWLIAVVFTLASLELAAESWQVMLSERHSTKLSCRAWARMERPPSWVHLDGCTLLADRPIPLVAKAPLLHPPVLIPLVAEGGHGPVLAYVQMPKAEVEEAIRSPARPFEGRMGPLSRFRASASYDRALPVLHLDEPSRSKVVLSAAAVALLLGTVSLKLRSNLRNIDASERLARKIRSEAGIALDQVYRIDLSPLIKLRRASWAAAPGWICTLVLLELGAVRPELELPSALALGSAIGLAFLGAIWAARRCFAATQLAWPAAGASLVLTVTAVVLAAGAGTPPQDRGFALALAGYGLWSIGYVLHSLKNVGLHPDGNFLLRVERAWQRTRRHPRLRLLIGKARFRYGIFHVAGTVLALIVGFVMLGVGAGVIGLSAGAAIYLAMRGRARRHVAVDANEAQAGDNRPAVLYLRSFADEEVVMARRAYGADRSISEWVAAQFALIGPVVTIAKPGESLPRVGPYRIVLPASGEWQAEIQARLTSAAAIVFVFGTTGSLLWELGQIEARGALPRTFFVFPPIDSIQLEQRWNQLEQHASIVPALRALGSIDPHLLLMAAIDAQGALSVVCCTKRSPVSYEMAFSALGLRSGLI